MRSMTPQEQSHLNAILACIPVSRRYHIASDTVYRMEIISSGDTTEELLPEFECHRSRAGEKILLLNKDTMMVIQESGDCHVATSEPPAESIKQGSAGTCYFVKTF